MSQHRRRLSRGRRARRSVRAFLFTTVVAAVVIGGGAKYLIGKYEVRLDPLGNVAANIASGRSGALLAAQRQNMILAAVASRSFQVIGSPTVSQNQSSSGGGGGATAIPAGPPPNPGTAQAIAQRLMPLYGFSVKAQYGCLNSLWTRESNWRYNAANASGAYGIPQALPGSKMATAGPNWQTDPTTQIKWGLGYIKNMYGTPCGAWDHELAYGWY